MTPKADPRPIAVFDSGIGGLTVLSHLARQFLDESFIYLGDTARLPYGDKSSQTILKYVQQNIRYLKSLQVKAVVIACNSASTAVLNQSHFEEIPILNVIHPGAQLAAAQTQNKKIGIIGTQATVRHAAYVSVLRKIDPAIEASQVPCPLLVPLVEQGWLDDPVTNLIVYRYLAPLREKNLDTLILGCTHYPLLENAIARVMGPHVALISSGLAVANNLRAAFDHGEMGIRTNASGTRLIRILTTDLSAQIEPMSRMILDGIEFTNPELVDLPT